MIKAEDLDFDCNDKKISHSGTREALEMRVEDGNSVTLKKTDISIAVQNIKQTGEGIYCGEVRYVEPYQALSKDGVVDGVDICFSYKHIFTCQHL